MKIPANWRKPNWKSWGRKVWQKARVYAVLIGVVALGIGIYGAYLLRELPKWQTETIAAAANVISSEIPRTETMPQAAENDEMAEHLTAADIAPVRVAMPSDQEQADAPEDAVQPAMAPVDSPEAEPDGQPVTAASDEGEEAVQAPILEQAPRWVYVDPAALLTESQPCHGAVISRGYGFTYDERYGDYRYHHGVDYSLADDRSVCAVRSGKVISIDTELEEVVISDGSWQAIYRPVSERTVSIGQSVSAGRALGNVPQDADVFFFAVQQKQ